MEIAIIGEGEVVIRFIDRHGQTLLQERLVVSGPPGVQALRYVSLSIGTVGGPAELAPVVASLGNSQQRVTFDGEDPARFARRRCRKIGCSATVARNAGCEAYRVGGVADHVHLAIRLSRTLTIADLVEMLKTSSSKWLKTQSASLAAFGWQRGYGCFSVGPTDLNSLCEYIDQQEEHHQRRTFQEEFRMFLEKYGIEYNEAYVWD